MVNDAETMKELLKYLVIKVQQKELDIEKAKQFINYIESKSQDKEEDIAIVGVACNFPDAPDKEQYWENIKTGRESIGDFPEKRLEDFKRIEDVSVLRKGGYLKSIDGFDYEYFNIPPKIALQIDPYHRNMLELLIETLEDAGYSRSSVYGENIGVFVGNDHTHRLNKSYIPFVSECDFSTITGSWSSILASRLSYILNLQGPALVIDTGCSSGLVALDAAIKAVRSGDCQSALVAAINLFLDPTSFGDETESQDFVCRPFDDSANGTVWSEGVGGIYIKKLSQAMKDGDNIYAVIKGIAINNDGKTNGITAPSARAQKKLLVKAWKNAGISPESLSYIETHGTGTALGDPIEINGLKSAFAEFTDKKQFCAIGSVKANIGHTVGAAGMASLIKVLLCLRERKLPPSIHFSKPNHLIDFVNSPVYVQDKLSDWKSEDGILRAGVSGFSLGGTNCHVVLEEAPKRKPKENARTLYLYPISAQNEELLLQTVKKHLCKLKNQEQSGNQYRIEDICYTMQVGRETLKTRSVILCDSVESLILGLEKIAKQKSIENSYIEDDRFLILINEEKHLADRVNFMERVKNSKFLQQIEKELSTKEISSKFIGVTYDYLSGKTVRWLDYYKGIEVQRVSLPAQLFNNVRLWDETERVRENLSIKQEELTITEQIQKVLASESKLEDAECRDMAVEKIIAWIWADVLGYPCIHMVDDFFELGGDSISSLKIIQMINMAFQCTLPNALLLEKSVFGEFIQCIKEEYFVNVDKILCGQVKEELQEELVETYEIPLTASQKSMYLSTKLDANAVSYNVTGITMQKNKQDIKQIEDNVRQLVNRHESLRASFHMMEDTPIQRIHKEVPITVEVHQLQAADEEEYDTFIQQEMKKFVRPFVLEQAPLFRVGYFEFENGPSFMAIDMHHIITDGTSMGNLFADFSVLCKGEKLPKLALSYKNVVEDLLKKQASQSVMDQKKFWVDLFKDDIPMLYLNTDRVRPTVQHFQGAKLYHRIDQDLLGELKSFAKKHNMTLYMLLLGSYYLLLSKMSNQEDIVIGTPVIGRPDIQYQNLVGMFVNTLPIRVNVDKESTILDFIAQIKEIVLKAFRNQDCPFEFIVDELRPDRTAGRSPLFDVYFALQNTDIGLEHSDERVIQYDNGSTKYDLTLNMREEKGQLLVEWEYDTELFYRSTIQLYAQRLEQLLRALMNSTEGLIKDLDICNELEREKIHQFSGLSNSTNEYESIVHQFEQCVKLHGEKTALVMGSQSMNYIELNEKANIIAHNLVEQNIKPKTAVAIMFERSFEMIITILGVLKAGCYYQPLNIDYPIGRISVMLDDTKANIILTSKNLKDKIAELSSETIRVIDVAKFHTKEGYEKNLDLPISGDDYAYIMYTSGTTGNPKGILIRQKSVLRVVRNNGYLDIQDSDVLLQLSDYSFDGSVFDIFGSLMNGAALVLVEKSIVIDSKLLAEEIETKKVTVFFITTALFNTLVDYSIHSLHSVRKILFGGENASLSHVKKAFEKLGPNRLIHVYGPTETTVFATAYPINEFHESDGLPIGRPIANTVTYVLDKEKRIQPIGAIGELYIGGDGLADCYLNKPEITKEKFLSSVVVSGDRMYKTGDLVVLKNSGLIYYAGRIDKQIKLRGFRIELGEIENCALKNHAIKRAHAGVHIAENGGKNLCLWIVSDEAIDVEEMKRHLEKELPSYMVPTFIVLMEELPLNKNGKIDESKLTNPIILQNEDIVPPQNEQQRKIADAWSSILGVEVQNIDSNFFALGGDSIKAIQVIAKLKEYNISLQVADIFASQTIRRLAEKASQEVSQFVEDEFLESLQMTAIQKQFLSNQEHDHIMFNQALLITTEIQLQYSQIVEAMEKICRHHAMLRLTLTEDRQLSIREYNDNLVYAIEAPENLSEADSKQLIHEAQKKVSLSDGSIVSIVTGLGENRNSFMIAIHHVAVDVVSWGIILEDFIKCITQPECILPPTTIPFGKWTSELHKFVDNGGFDSEVPYWRKVANEIINSVPLFNETIVKRCEGISKEIIIAKEKAEQICLQAKEICDADAVHVVLGIVSKALLKWKKQQNVAINMEGHGREKLNEDYDLSRTVGWFTSNYPLVVEDRENIEEFIVSIKKKMSYVPNKGVGYGALKYSDSTNRKQDRTIFEQVNPQVSFNYLGIQSQQHEEVKVEYLKADDTVGEEYESHFIVDIIAQQDERGIVIEVRYPREWISNHMEESFLSNIQSSVDEILIGLQTAEKSDILIESANVKDEIGDILQDILDIL